MPFFYKLFFYKTLMTGKIIRYKSTNWLRR
ncbi:MAG: hypothetical protein RL757_1988 [Bacteroidota bacterium]|jgi:hypothetical protein